MPNKRITLSLLVDIKDDILTLNGLEAERNETGLPLTIDLIHTLFTLMIESIEDDPDHYAIQDMLNSLRIPIETPC